MAAQQEDKTRNFWEGEWVCADCGYIYDVDDCGGLFLEEQVCLYFFVVFCCREKIETSQNKQGSWASFLGGIDARARACTT